MKRNVLMIGLLSLGLLAAGCSNRMGNFTVLSTKNTEIGKKYVRLGDNRVKGEDSKPIIVIIPIGQPNMQEAVDRALEKSGAQILTDAVIYYDYYYIPYIYGEIKYRVEGIPWKQVGDLNSKLDEDVKNAKEIYTVKQVNGQSEFVRITKSDPILDTVH